MVKLSGADKIKHCTNCRDDFYNHGDNSTTGECWNLAKAKVITAYRIGWWTPQDKVENFTKVTTLDCHNETGSFAFYRNLPEHLRGSK